MVGANGLEPGQKLGCADTAYIRSIIQEQVSVHLPSKLDDSDDQLTVINFFQQNLFFFYNCLTNIIKGAKLKKSHTTQTHRSIVERKILSMKDHEIVEGGKIEKIETSEQEIDVALSLCNLKELSRQKLMHIIPQRGPFVQNSHIITSTLELPLKIPKKMSLHAADLSQHIKDFH